MSAILADATRTGDVRGFFAGGFDLVKLALLSNLAKNMWLQTSGSGTMQFDYAVIRRVPGYSQMAPSITYVSLHDPQDRLLGGEIGETMDAIDRFLDELQGQIDRRISRFQRRLERDLAGCFFMERAVLVGGRRNSLSKKELKIMRERNAGPLITICFRWLYASFPISPFSAASADQMRKAITEHTNPNISTINLIQLPNFQASARAMISAFGTFLDPRRCCE